MRVTFLYQCTHCGKKKEVEPGVSATLMKEFDPQVNADLWVTLAARVIRLHRCPDTRPTVYGMMRFIGFVVQE